MTGNCAVPPAHQSTCVMEYQDIKQRLTLGLWCDTVQKQETLKSFNTWDRLDPLISLRRALGFKRRDWQYPE